MKSLPPQAWLNATALMRPTFSPIVQPLEGLLLSSPIDPADAGSELFERTVTDCREQLAWLEREYPQATSRYEPAIDDELTQILRSKLQERLDFNRNAARLFRDAEQLLATAKKDEE